MKVEGSKIDWAFDQKVQPFLTFHFLCGIVADINCSPGVQTRLEVLYASTDSRISCRI